MDLIGPCIVQVRERPYEFDALTVIDTVTNLVEIIRVDDETSDTFPFWGWKNTLRLDILRHTVAL
jgi:hypothetical protein